MRTSRSESLTDSAELCIVLIRDHRAWIHSVTNKLKGKPLLDLVGGVIEDYEFLWNEYYFSTATL